MDQPWPQPLIGDVRGSECRPDATLAVMLRRQNQIQFRRLTKAPAVAHCPTPIPCLARIIYSVCPAILKILLHYFESPIITVSILQDSSLPFATSAFVSASLHMP